MVHNVTESVRQLTICLNDASNKSLHNLSLAQTATLGVVDDMEFLRKFLEKTIRSLLPKLVRRYSLNNASLSACAETCEQNGDTESLKDLANKYKTNRSFNLADAYVYEAIQAIASIVYAPEDPSRFIGLLDYAFMSMSKISDEYLTLAADLAVETLKELNSPGTSLVS